MLELKPRPLNAPTSVTDRNVEMDADSPYLSKCSWDFTVTDGIERKGQWAETGAHRKLFSANVELSIFQ
jgi:hypothetical protein